MKKSGRSLLGDLLSLFYGRPDSRPRNVVVTIPAIPDTQQESGAHKWLYCELKQFPLVLGLTRNHAALSTPRSYDSQSVTKSLTSRAASQLPLPSQARFAASDES
jgi:hypothetical protein